MMFRVFCVFAMFAPFGEVDHKISEVSETKSELGFGWKFFIPPSCCFHVNRP